MAARAAASRLALPSQNALQVLGTKQGWSIATRVRTSPIPGAGNGRFAEKFVPKSTLVVMKPYLPMAKIDSLLTVPLDSTITFDNVGDLEKYITLAKLEGGFSRERLLQEFGHFICGYDGRRAFLNVSTWTMNHGENNADGLINFEEHRMHDGTVGIAGITEKDVQPSDELLNNYRLFVLPDFYKEYCKEYGFKDLRTNVLEHLPEQLPIALPDTFHQKRHQVFAAI